MRHAATLCYRNLSRRNLNTLINLDRIAVNNLATKTQCEFDSERALSGSSRSNDGDDGSAGRAGSAGILPAFSSFLLGFA